MFDLEERIAAWRKSMAAALGDKADAIDELESHLREELHRLALAGRPAAEAWDIAIERLNGAWLNRFGLLLNERDSSRAGLFLQVTGWIRLDTQDLRLIASFARGQKANCRRYTAANLEYLPRLLRRYIRIKEIRLDRAEPHFSIP